MSLPFFTEIDSCNINYLYIDRQQGLQPPPEKVTSGFDVGVLLIDS